MRIAIVALGLTGLIAAAPAMAHGARPQMLPHWGGPFGAWYGGWQAPTVIETGGQAVAEEEAGPPAAGPRYLAAAVPPPPGRQRQQARRA